MSVRANHSPKACEPLLGLARIKPFLHRALFFFFLDLFPVSANNKRPSSSAIRQPESNVCPATLAPRTIGPRSFREGPPCLPPLFPAAHTPKLNIWIQSSPRRRPPQRGPRSSLLAAAPSAAAAAMALFLARGRRWRRRRRTSSTKRKTFVKGKLGFLSDTKVTALPASASASASAAASATSSDKIASGGRAQTRQGPE